MVSKVHPALDKPALAAGSGRTTRWDDAIGGAGVRATARSTIGASRVRAMVESETARILGPMGMTLVAQAWARGRPRGLSSLMAVLREIGEGMDDAEEAERYVRRTVQRVMDAARGR